MRTIECTREQDVIDALASGRWPERAPGDLHAHVASCPVCSDTLTVASLVLADRDDPAADPHIPSSAVMWWRAQMRARQEAAREAARPIAVAQVVGAICAVAVLLVVGLWFSPLAGEWFTDVAAGNREFSLRGALTMYGWLLPALMILFSLVVTPLVYFAVAED
jgi:hypothetical protein